MIRVLIVEDNETKQSQIRSLLTSNFESEVSIVSNINAAYPSVSKTDLDLIILDMTFQISHTDGSLDTRKVALGGIELLQYMKAMEINVPVIVATQHDSFLQPGGLEITSVAELDEVLSSAFPGIYVGVVKVDLPSNNWQDDMVNTIRKGVQV
jgi:CheY-like chemotaxis protein